MIVARGIALGVHSGLAGPEGPVKSEAPLGHWVACCKQHTGQAWQKKQSSGRVVFVTEKPRRDRRCRVVDRTIKNNHCSYG